MNHDLTNNNRVSHYDSRNAGQRPSNEHSLNDSPINSELIANSVRSGLQRQVVNAKTAASASGFIGGAEALHGEEFTTPELLHNAVADDNNYKVYRRGRRKKRPGVFLGPAVFPSNRPSDKAQGNVRSSSVRSQFQTSHSALNSVPSDEIIKSIIGASERLNRTQAAVLMKQQYHR